MTLHRDKNAFFAYKLRHEMRKGDLSVDCLAEQLGVTYEHARKLVNGAALPSPCLLSTLCGIFDLEQREVLDLVATDRLRHRFGDALWTYLGKNPKYERLYLIWPYMSSHKIEQLLIIAKALARSNRKHMT